MPFKEDADMLRKVAGFDEDLRSEGVRAANCVLSLLRILGVSSSPVARAAAAHALRRALPRLGRSIAVAEEDERLTSWLSTQRRDFVAGLAKCLTLPFSSEESREDREECDRALVACAAVQGEKGWKIVLRAATCAGCLEPVKEAVARYADLRVWALQIVCERNAPTEEVKVERAVSDTKKRKRQAHADKSNDGNVDGPVWLANRLELLYACSTADPVSASARASSDAGNEVHMDVSKRLRREFGNAWLCVLTDPSLTPSQRTSALAVLPRTVIPRMSNPLRLSDFLTDAYNSAKTTDDTRVALAALDALFILVAKYRLDYPDFYPKLYAMLTPYALFVAPERERFLTLSATFLTRGIYLPRTMVASFVKRLVRRALVAPPAGAMWCLRLAVELLQKHPSVSFLVHKTVDFFDSSSKDFEDNTAMSTASDPFDDSVSDPQATGAEASSLWELELLQNHMSPAVSRLVDSFSRDVRKRNTPQPPGDLRDYAALLFSDVFGAEFKRRSKSTPFAYFAPNSPEAQGIEAKLAPSLMWQ